MIIFDNSITYMLTIDDPQLDSKSSLPLTTVDPKIFTCMLSKSIMLYQRLAQKGPE
jgi:hypothetical protein